MCGELWSFFEEVIAFLEIAPESDEPGLIGMRGCQRFEPALGEARRKNLNRQMLLALTVDKNRKPIDFLDPIVRDGNAPDGCTVSVKKNIATKIWAKTKNPVGGVWIVDMQAQKEIALGVEPIKFVEAFRDLLVAIPALWAQDTG